VTTWGFSPRESAAQVVCKESEAQLATLDGGNEIFIRQCESQSNSAGEAAFIIRPNDPREWSQILSAQSTEEVVFIIPLGLVAYGFGGSFEEILTNDFNSGRNHLVVDILPSDAGFTSRGCGTWAPFLATGPKSITNGTWVVGDALLPGIWTSTPTESCYWARLSGFSGSFTEIITNEFTYESSIVEIASTDAGFKTNGCGTWTKIS
jgi:hypothetical protein